MPQSRLADDIFKACYSYLSEEILLDIDIALADDSHVMSSIIFSEK